MLTKWVNGIKNPIVRNGVAQWIKEHRKVQILTIYIPMNYLIERGIPEEIMPIINAHKVVLDIVNMMYIVLESISYYRSGANMISDEFSEEYLLSKIEEFKT